MTWMTRSAVLILTGLVVAGPAIGGGSVADRRPKYPALRKSPNVPRPLHRVPVPVELKLDVRSTAAVGSPPRSRSTGAAVRTRPGAASPPVHDRRYDEALQAAALRAARLAAESAFRSSGAREYYRVGFFEGLREGAKDTHGISAAFAYGELSGAHDQDAYRAGAEVGEAEAASLAFTRATEQVVSQFRDLSSTPRFLPRYGEPLFESAGTEVEEPRLSDVFTEFPLASFAPIRARYERYLMSWDYDPPRLTRCASYTEFYDADWADPEPHLRFWTTRSLVETYGHQAAARLESRFRQIFLAVYPEQLAAVYAEHGPPAHELGFDDGWTYSTFARQELAFRRGYASGFRRAFADGSLDGFHRAYARAYEDAYREAFRDWSSHPKLQVVDAWLEEVEVDGIFSPGEKVVAGFEVVNFGGRGTEADVVLEGEALERSARAWIEVPRRARVPAERFLDASIRAEVKPRTRTDLQLRVDDASYVVPVRVEHALQLDSRALRVLRADLEGEVRIETRLHNVSRRPRAAVVELATPAWAGLRDAREIEMVPAGGHVDVVYDVNGLEPLDLIGGDLSFELVASANGIVHDSLDHDLRDTARDLGNRDLLIYMTRLAADARVSRQRIRAARDLMLLRLREDWKVAVIGRGNPYKSDFKNDGRETALGDLVATSRAVLPTATRPEVFVGLGQEIERLAGKLPGAHPFLRKYAVRLAGRL